jgi:hypothetical protein
MKQLSFSTIVFLSLVLQSAAQNTKRFDIFTYSAPVKFKLKEEKHRLVYEVKEGNSFCQLYLWPANKVLQIHRQILKPTGIILPAININ